MRNESDMLSYTVLIKLDQFQFYTYPSVHFLCHNIITFFKTPKTFIMVIGMSLRLQKMDSTKTVFNILSLE